jgi:hypothetical protein
MRIEELVKKQLEKSIETRKAEINSSNQTPADEEDSVGRSEQKLPPLYLCVCVCARVSSRVYLVVGYFLSSLLLICLLDQSTENSHQDPRKL